MVRCVVSVVLFLGWCCVGPAVAASVDPCRPSGPLLYGAAFNPTGNPIGGGFGYNRIPSMASAARLVTNASSLIAALGAAKAGQTVYIADDAEIDVTGTKDIVIPANVTVASGRGRTESTLGALVYTTDPALSSNSVFKSGGSGVRITGIRIRGPDPEVGDHGYSQTSAEPGIQRSLSRGVHTAHPSFEIDNCEVSGFSHAGVMVDLGATGAWVHHNYIHHCRRTGLGYGVVLGYTTEARRIDVVIEANQLDACRHVIASTGKQYSSYEARYNVASKDQQGHAFDRHGTVDPGSWVGGDGGDYTVVHHNTVLSKSVRAVSIRGVPTVLNGAQVYRNWFAHSKQSDAVWVFEAENHTDRWSVTDNWYGANPPPSTYEPTVVVSDASLTMGRAPFAASLSSVGSYSPIGSLSGFKWDMGDSAVLYGRTADHTFDAAGTQLATLSAADKRGIMAYGTAQVTAYPPSASVVAKGPYWLSFAVKDSYRGSRVGYYEKRVLVDGTIVWRDDIAGDEGWQHIVVDANKLVSGKPTVKLSLQVVAMNAVTDPMTQIIEAIVYYDDVVLFGGKVEDHFENGLGAWTWSKTAGTPWGCGTTTGDSHSGVSSLYIAMPYNTASFANSTAELTLTTSVSAKSAIGMWAFDETAGRVAADNSAWIRNCKFSSGMGSNAWKRGAIGYALSFDGVDDGLECGADFDVSLVHTAGTIEFFVSRSSSSTAPATILELYSTTSASRLSIGLSATGAVKVDVVGTQTINLVTTSAIAPDVWSHVAVTHSGTRTAVFVNGVEASVNGNDGAVWLNAVSANRIRIGGGSAGHFRGSLDEVSVSSSVLTAADIKSHSDSIAPLLVMHFNEGKGASTADASARGHNGNFSSTMDAAKAWVGGVSGTAVAFPGTSTAMVTVTDPQRELAPAGDFSIELWLRFDSFTQNEVVFDNGFVQLTHRGGWAGNRTFFLLRIQNASTDDGDSAWAGTTGVRTDSHLSLGQWHHLVMVRSGNHLLSYLDGKLERRILGFNGNVADLSKAKDLVFGGSNFVGAVDEVTFHNRELRAVEIAATYEKFAAVPTASSNLCISSNDDGNGGDAVSSSSVPSVHAVILALVTLLLFM